MVKAFAGRFYWNPSTTIVDDENPVGQAAARFVFDDLNGYGRSTGARTTSRTPPTIRSFTSSTGCPTCPRTGGTSTRAGMACCRPTATTTRVEVALNRR